MRSLAQIIEACGGAAAIAAASGGAITKDAVYKWPQIGIADRHWEILIRLADASAEELYQANRIARGQSAPVVEAAE
ncbi:MAG TPA: hypothetical protein VMF90_06035 [Rhizobiaceae bacterium]|nr:hypothetical protein [Rhizobiaceae bacterium]